jgi:hypothetical protein
MTYQALLIGNSVFDADAGLNPLNAPVKDVARLHRALVDPDTGLFDDDHVRLVTERNCDDILDELDRFFSAGRKDDLLLLYYSGHGLLDERNRLYLCGRDTRSDRLLRTAVSNVRVNEFVTQSMCQRTVIVLDCCSSGMFKGGSVGAQMAGPGRYIVSSTRGADLANDAVTATGTSLFTEHLVEGLLGAAPDTNEDGFIDLREIYDYVRDRLLGTTKQVPHCRFDGDAALSMARVRNLPRVARAPSGQRYRLNEPTFALAENIITLRDVELDEQLRPEVVEVIQLGDAPLDLVARTDDEWLSATVSTDGVIVVLRPQLGRNRGKITIRDQASGSAQVLRVEAHVRPASIVSPAAKSGPADASAGASAPAATPSGRDPAGAVGAPPEIGPSAGPDPAGFPATGQATTGEVAAAAGASAGYAPPPTSSYAPPAAGYAPPPAAGYPPPSQPPLSQPPPTQPQQFPQGGQWYPPQPAAWSPATPYGGAPPSPPGPQPHQMHGAPGPRPASGQSVNFLGLGIAGLGALLLIIAFSGVSWYKDSHTGETANVSQLQNGAAQTHAAFAEAFFNGLGWLLIVATVAAGVLACLPVGPAQNWLRRGAVALGLFSIALMLVALDDLWTKVRDVTGQTDVGVWSHTDTGLGLALWGFALAGCGGLIRRRRPRVPNR